jgi:8-oxo-dGTP pyrophosphatase MutT (NUDIX family)
MDPIVICAIVREVEGREELLLGRYHPEHKKPYLRGLRTTPGGNLQPNEDCIEAGLRKIQEETGTAQGLTPILHQTFPRVRVVAPNFPPEGRAVSVVLLQADSGYCPGEVVGDWVWSPLNQLTAAEMSPVVALAMSWILPVRDLEVSRETR